MLTAGIALLGVVASAAEPSPDALPAGAKARLGGVRLRHDGPVRAVAFAPDGRTLLTAGDDGPLRIWDAADGRLLRSLEHHEGPVHALAVSPDGKSVASAGADRAVRLWDLGGGEPTVREGHTHWVLAVAWSPDGRTLATVGGDDTVRLWADAGRGDPVRLDVPSPRAAYWSPDGRVLAIACGQRRGVELRDPAGKPIRTLAAPPDALAAWSPDGKALAVAGTGGLTVFDPASGARLRNLDLPDTAVTALAWSPDGRSLALAVITDDGVRRLRLLAAADLRETAAATVPSKFWALGWSPDGRRLATAGQDGRVRWWDDRLNERSPEGTAGEAVTGLAASADGKTLWIGSADGSVRRWEPAAGGAARTLLRGAAVQTLAVSADGRTLAVASGAEGRLRLHSADDGRELADLTGHAGPVFAAAFPPDGKTLVTGGRDHKVRVWDVAAARLLETLEEHDGDVRAVTFSADGATFATLGAGREDGVVRLVDARTRRLRFRLTGLEHGRALAFSPEGRWLATAGLDGTVRLWERASGHVGHRLAMDAPVRAVAFSADGRRVFAGGDAGDVRVFDALTGERVAVLSGHGAPVARLAVADGAVISGSADGTVLIWDAGVKPDRPPAADDPPADAELERLWERLADGQPAKAWSAVPGLVRGGERAAAVIRDRLPAANGEFHKTVAGLIRDLDDDAFDTREAASASLRKLGATAEPAMRRALAGKPSPEQRMRLRELLEPFGGEGPAGPSAGQLLRVARAIAVLERLDGPVARGHLRALADGPEDARETVEARAALRRLGVR